MITFGQVVHNSNLGKIKHETVQIPLNKNIPNGFYQVLIEVAGKKAIRLLAMGLFRGQKIGKLISNNFKSIFTNFHFPNVLPLLSLLPPHLAE